MIDVIVNEQMTSLVVFKQTFGYSILKNDGLIAFLSKKVEFIFSWVMNFLGKQTPYKDYKAIFFVSL